MMGQNAWIPQDQRARRGGRGWLQTLLIGALLFIAATIVLFLTQDPNLYPTVILIGNFLVPVVFVIFLYDHQHLSTLTPEVIAKSFFFGGILGILGASELETLLLPRPMNPYQGLSLFGGITIGLIEEGCKIAAVAFLARNMRHTATIDGLLLGAAVGMGFAALESTGYAFTAFLTSRGNFDASIISTVLRGLLAPFGHGTWTAILGAVLFRASTPDRFRVTGGVIITYLFVSLLHGLWDGLPYTLYFVVPPGIPISVATLVIGMVGLAVLAAIYRLGNRQKIQQP